ncbi:MAG: M48 family metalloprotease [Alphaproteobacteria bacterium]|nr:M48 family metalloprotease [Alphaproteobacteria bacterium]
MPEIKMVHNDSINDGTKQATTNPEILNDIRDKLIETFHLVSSNSKTQPTEAYIKAIALKLYKYVEEFKDFNWDNLHVRIIDDNSPNACFLSGNQFGLTESYICFTKGLFKTCKSEDELAYIIGHEMAHAVLKKQGKEGNDKIEEGVADSLSIRSLISQGYDPRAALEFRNKMPSDISIPDIIDVHPLNKTRISVIEGVIMKYGHGLPKDPMYSPLSLQTKQIEDCQFVSHLNSTFSDQNYLNSTPLQKLQILLDVINREAVNSYEEYQSCSVLSDASRFLTAVTHLAFETPVDKKNDSFYLSPTHQDIFKKEFLNILNQATDNEKQKIFNSLYQYLTDTLHVTSHNEQKQNDIINLCRLMTAQTLRVLGNQVDFSKIPELSGLVKSLKDLILPQNSTQKQSVLSKLWHIFKKNSPAKNLTVQTDEEKEKTDALLRCVYQNVYTIRKILYTLNTQQAQDFFENENKRDIFTGLYTKNPLPVQVMLEKLIKERVGLSIVPNQPHPLAHLLARAEEEWVKRTQEIKKIKDKDRHAKIPNELLYRESIADILALYGIFEPRSTLFESVLSTLYLRNDLDKAMEKEYSDYYLPFGVQIGLWHNQQNIQDKGNHLTHQAGVRVLDDIIEVYQYNQHTGQITNISVIKKDIFFKNSLQKNQEEKYKAFDLLGRIFEMQPKAEIKENQRKSLIFDIRKRIHRIQNLNETDVLRDAASVLAEMDFLFNVAFNRTSYMHHINTYDTQIKNQLLSVQTPQIQEQLYQRYFEIVGIVLQDERAVQILKESPFLNLSFNYGNDLCGPAVYNTDKYIQFCTEHKLLDVLKIKALNCRTLSEKMPEFFEKIFQYDTPIDATTLKKAYSSVIYNYTKDLNYDAKRNNWCGVLKRYFNNPETPLTIPYSLCEDLIKNNSYKSNEAFLYQRLFQNAIKPENYPEKLFQKVFLFIALSQSIGVHQVQNLTEKDFEPLTNVIIQDLFAVPKMDERINLLNDLRTFGERTSPIISSLIDKILDSEDFWNVQLQDAIDAYCLFIYRNMFNSDLKTQRAVLQKLLKKIEKEPLIEREKYYSQLLSGRNDIIFSDLKEQIVQKWSKTVLDLIGEDTGEPDYLEKVQPYVDRLKTEETGKELFSYKKDVRYASLSGETYRAVAIQLQNDLVAQEELVRRLNPLKQYDLSNSNKNQGVGILADLIVVLTRDKETSEASIRFLLNPASNETAESLKDSIEKRHTMINLSNGYVKVSSEMLIEYHSLFWKSSLETRALIMKEFLKSVVPDFYKNIDENNQRRRVKDNKKQQEYLFDFVMKQLFPPEEDIPNRDVLLEGLRSYIHQHPTYEAEFLLATFLTARRKTGENDDAFELGKTARLFFENKGPAEVKVGQFLASRSDLPVDFTDEMKKLTNQAAIPSRTEIYDLLRTYHPEILERLRQNKQKLGRVLAAGSHFITIDLGDEILSLGKERSGQKASQGFERMIDTFEDLKQKGISPENVAVLSDCAKQAADMNMIETSADAGYQQFRLSRELYDPVTITVDGYTVHFKTMGWLGYSTKHCSEGNGQWLQSYKLMEKAQGIDFVDMPTDTPEQKSLKQATAKANFILNLGCILKGGVFDDDRHGAQLKVLNHPKNPQHIYISLFDTGSCSLQEPLPAERELFGYLLFKTVQQSLFGKNHLDNDDFTAKFTQNFSDCMVQIRKENNDNTPLYLAKVQRALGALSHFTNDIPENERLSVLLTALKTMPIHPDIINGMYRSASVFEKNMLDILFRQLGIGENGQQDVAVDKKTSEILTDLFAFNPIEPKLSSTIQAYGHQRLGLTEKEQEECGNMVMNIVKHISEMSDKKNISQIMNSLPNNKQTAYIYEMLFALGQAISKEKLSADKLTYILHELGHKKISKPFINGISSHLGMVERMALKMVISSDGTIKPEGLKLIERTGAFKSLSEKITQVATYFAPRIQAQPITVQINPNGLPPLTQPKPMTDITHIVVNGSDDFLRYTRQAVQKKVSVISPKADGASLG